MTIRITDAVKPERVRKTADGFLVADVCVARTGVQNYLGSEVGRPDLDRVRLYRPESVVFGDAAMKGYAHRPSTIDHPPVDVTAENWRTLATGHTGGEVMRDGDMVRVPMMLMDAQAIADYESGRRTQLSMGYSATIDFQDGTSPQGEPYDAVMTSYQINHIAQVQKARGGEQLRIGDGIMRDDDDDLPAVPTNQPGGPKMAQLKTVVHDGLSIEMPELAAQAFAVLQKRVHDSEQSVQALKDAHADALKTMNGQLATKDAEIEGLKKTQLNDAAIDGLVKDRADLLAKATLLCDADFTGKTPAEIRRTVVAAKLGDAAIEGKPEAYIDARFEIMVEDGQQIDPVRQSFQARDSAPRQDPHDNGQEAYEQRLRDAHKNLKTA